MQKNSFKFKRNFYTLMSDMTDKQISEFIKGVCGYVFDGKQFYTKDNYLKGVFLYVKRELDVAAANSANGRKGGLISAEIRKCEERKVVFDSGVIMGGVVTEHAIEHLVNSLKNDADSGGGKDGKVVGFEEKREAG